MKRPPRVTTPEEPVKPQTSTRVSGRKYLRVPESEPDTVFKNIGEQVATKALKWSYFAIENNVGVHYYQVLNQQ